MEKAGKKVLIVGHDATAYTLAKQMLELENVSEVFVASGNNAISEFAKVVDIRENNVQELLEFALENAIDLTVVQSEDAIRADISSIFSTNGQLIFAPTKASAFICQNKSNGKKFMYKNNIPCPRFGIFDKPQNALEHIKNSKLPVVIKSEELQQNGVLVCNTVNLAKNYTDALFDSGEKRVLIEDYIFGHEFSFYVITDGYHALDLGCVATYKYELDGNGGLLSSGMGAFADDYTISNNIKAQIMNNIIYPTLNALAKDGKPYTGILGVDLVKDYNDNLFVIEFNPFLKSPDAQCILPLIKQNLYNLFLACAIGSFADDYEYIELFNQSAAACVIRSSKENSIIEGLDKIDENTQIAHFNTRKNKYLEYETPKGRAIILSRKASTLARAVNEMYEDIELIDFDGIKYRKDIGKIIQM